MSAKRGSYEMLVSASSTEEAQAIALEALPKGSTATQITSIPTEDPDTFIVRIKFRRAEAEGEY